MNAHSEKPCSEIQKRLLLWFEANKRDLPWRHGYSPYAVWISEVMLQQTQVKTVVPYYERWMERFPDVRSVAPAAEEELLKYWEGMGYYSRARNIHKTARILVDEFRGNFPRDHRAILKLPGIGRYTAGAIMSFAFNEEYPAVDANIERVLARLFNVETPVREKIARDFLWKTAEELIPKGKARKFNQALMELGAVVCLPKNPACLHCPLKGLCKSFQAGIAEKRPVFARRKAAVAIEVAIGVLFRDGKIFIQKRPPWGLMPHLWEFPGGKLKNGETPREALVRELREELSVDVCRLERITTLKHAYTSFKVTLHAFSCALCQEDREPVPSAAVDARWVLPAELDLYAFPAANRKLIKLLEG